MDVFGGAPRFLAYPRPVVVQSGTDAALKCQIGGDPRPTVIWERNNKQIQPEGRYRLFEDGNVYNLIISGASAEDSGQYICKAKNSIGETYAAATLKVEGEAQKRELREENKPRFLIKPLSTRVGRGEDAVFSCKLWGNPRPEVVWEKDGKRLNEIFESTHFSVGYQDGGWFQLKIFKARAPDGGVYTCKARNEFGEGLAGAVLLVDAGPGHEEEGIRNGFANGHWKAHQSKQRVGRQVTVRQKDDLLANTTKVKMFAVTEGKHAKFRCFVTGKPKPEIIWRKDGRLIMSGRRYLLYEDREGYFTLKVLYCKQQDNGVYVCAASNTAGQTLSAVHLFVKEPLVRFKQPLSDLEVWERDLAILECEVPEDSVPTTWYLEDRRLQPGAKYGMEEWGTKRRLTIRDIGADDDGIYLCEMADGGRSIAEVSVRGTIVRKLPRKVDVLEGENAAFCVEVEEEEMEIHWFKDEVELRETHQTIIKSFGKTHILVFVNTSPQDSGTVTFIVGRSKTSSHLRVKATRHSPPSCPVGVQINLERANAALLSWVPAHDSRRNPPSGYVLERQEVGTQEWLQCLTTDSATSVEILGDSVPCEADYRFRIYSVNKYGKSGHVEFPRAAHLVPVAKIQAPLQDALVPEGQDACFTIDLSASVIGTWFLNGAQIQDDERFSMRRSRTHHSLRIRGVREADNGAEITFIAYGIRDSAALYIQAPLVKFTPLSEMDRNKFIEVGNPIVLYCELSDPAAPVHWYKNGVELHTMDNLHIQSEGTMRRIVIQSAEFSHSGVYSCDAVDDVIRFNVEVEAPPARFSSIPEAEKHKSIEAGSPIVLRCEISDPTAQVCWYKDGIQLHSKPGTDIHSDGNTRTLVVHSADFIHSGMYIGKTKSDVVKFNVDIKAPPVRFAALPDVEKSKSFEAGSPVVPQCEISDPAAEVFWCKDGTELHHQNGLDIQSEGNRRTLAIQSAEASHSGLYSCATEDDASEFLVDIKESATVAPPVRFSAVPEVKRQEPNEPGSPAVLECEISHPTAQVCWHKDGKELHPKTGIDVRSNGIMRTHVVQPAELSNSGTYNCETTDDAIKFNVEMKAQPVKFSLIPEVEKNKSIEAGSPVVLQCEISDPTDHVRWYKDGIEISPQPGLGIESDGVIQKLVVKSADLSHAGTYSCQTTDDAIHFNVDIAELPQSLVYSCEISDEAVQSAMDVKAPPVRFAAIPEAEMQNPVEAGRPIVLQSEISDPSDQVCWYKDGSHIRPVTDETIKSVDSERTLIFTSAEHFHSGLHSCDAAGDMDTFKGDAGASSERISAPEAEKNKSKEENCSAVRHSDISDPKTQICWYEDKTKTIPEPEIDTQCKDNIGRLTVQSPEVSHLQEYSYEVDDDALRLKVDVKAPPMTFRVIPELERHESIEAGDPVTLQRELSDPTALVSWQMDGTKDGTEVLPEPGQDIQSEDSIRRLVVQSADLSHTGIYSCETMDDAVRFNVDIKAPPLMFSVVPEAEKHKTVEAGNSIALQCEISESTAQVCWYKDGMQVHQQPGMEMHSEARKRTLLIPAAEVCHSGVYSCNTADDTVKFYVDVKAPRVMSPEVEKSKSIEVGHHVAPQCELSDSPAPLCWHKDGTQLHPGTGATMQSDGSATALTIPSADFFYAGIPRCKTPDDVDKYNAGIKAPSVRFIELPEIEQHKSYEAESPIVLQCEVSDPTAQVWWYKDGKPLHPKSGVDIQSEANMRKLIILSADLCHSGVYSCNTMDDATQFYVDIKAVPPAPPPDSPAPAVGSPPIPEEEKSKTSEEGSPGLLHWEIPDPTAQVRRCKTEEKQLPPESRSVEVQSKDNTGGVFVPSEDLAHDDNNSSRTKEDVVEIKTDEKAPPVKFTELPEGEKEKKVEVGSPIALQCEISDPGAQVCWFKDGTEISSQPGVKIHTEGAVRTLAIQSAELSHCGLYSCVSSDDVLTFKVDVQAAPVKFSAAPEAEKHKVIEAGSLISLQCEISEPTGQVCWYKDGIELHPKTGLEIRSDGAVRRLDVHSAEPSHSGMYRCESKDDAIEFKVDVEAPAVRFSAVPEVEKNKAFEPGCPIVLHCEISDPTAHVCWYKDGILINSKAGVEIRSEGTTKTLVIHSADFSRSGVYICKTADDISEFYVDVTEPPVTFVEIPEQNRHRSVVELDPLVLQCEVSRPNATTQWYKDGIEIQPTNNISMHANGVARQLIIRSTQLSDNGMYACRAGDSTLLFKVVIREPPVLIIYPKEDVHLDRHVSEEIVLSCELSRPNATVHWYKDGQKLQESENIKLKTEGPYRRLKILHGAMEDSGEYVCDTADDSIFFQLNITEAPIRIVSPSQSQMELCQQTSERMVLSCELSRANAAVRWYRDGLEVEENENLILEVDGVYRRLIIPETTVQDSAEYVCDTADDSMTFFVNIAEPPVRFVRPRKMASTVENFVGDPVVLECEVSRPNAQVSWKKEGEEIEENKNVTIVEDGIFRQLTIHSSTPEDAGQYICDAKDDVMDFQVKIKEQPVKILRRRDMKTEQQCLVSDDIELECELSSASGVAKWYKDGVEIAENKHFCFEEEGAFRSLVIFNAELKDSGEYLCDVQDDSVVFHVTVQEPPVSILGNSESPEHHSLLTGDDLILECEVSRPSAPVKWLHNGRLLSSNPRTHIESHGTVRKLVLSRLEPSDSGEYTCDAIDDKMITVVKVQEPPVKFLNKAEFNTVTAYENERVTLTAMASRGSASVRWLKDLQCIDEGRFEASREGNAYLLTIASLKRSDSGKYTCDAGTDQIHFSLVVKQPRVKFSRPLESAVVRENGPVTLRCELSRPEGDVLWLKDGKEITHSRRRTIRADGRERTLTIHNVTAQDAGEYTCESTDDRTCARIKVETPRIVEFITELHSITVLEGEDAVFKCVVSPGDAKLVWHRDGQPVVPNKRLAVSSNGLCHILHVRCCQVSDSCKITAVAEGISSEASLQVQEAQVLFTKKMEPVSAEEYREATLEVEVSRESGEVRWIRQGVVIKPGPKFTLGQSGRKRTLTVHKLALSDQGGYRCETLHDHTQAVLRVEPRKVTIKKGLTQVETFERETASFEVELSHPDVQGMWQKDGVRLKPSNYCRISAKGPKHSLTLSNLSLGDTSTITFSAGTVGTSARLTVKEPPVTVLKKMEDLSVPEGSTASIECELSRQNVEVNWLKNGTVVKPDKKHRIYSVGRKRFLQILKCDTSDSGTYKCDAGEVSASCTLDVYERDVAILHGLEDLDIQEDQNAVFVCEVSLDSVPGEWFRNGETIRQTSGIKIRQEGTKHFLLMCNVKAEDSGEIKFVAKQAESTAYLDVEALPVTIVKPLQDKTAVENSRVVLDCTVSNPRSSIRWYHGSDVVLPSDHFEICSEGCYRKLVIQHVALEDEGIYSVQVGEHTSSARLTVEACVGDK